MTYAAAALLVAAFVAAAVLVLPAVRRSGLGIFHPAVAWLALEAVFFGVGSVVLTIDGRSGPGLYVAGAVVAFGLGVAASAIVAARRARAAALPRPEDDAGTEAPAGDGGIRIVAAVALAVVALIALGPTLIRIGLPFLAGDITGARAEFVGLPVQLIRVALPALVIAAAVTTWRRRRVTRTSVAVIVLAVAVVGLEVAFASRYLAAELVAAVVIARGLDGRSIPRWLLLSGALASVLVFGGIQVLRAYDQAEGRELAFVIERTVNRVVLIQPRTIEALQAAIPAEQPPYGGLTWLHRLGPQFGRSDIPNLGYWIYERLYPNQAIAGYAAPGLLGEAWANFAAAGIFLFALFGVAVERFGALIGRRRAGIADIAAGSLAILFIARTHALGLNGLVLLLCLVVIWRLLAGGGASDLLRDVRAVFAWRT